MVSRYLLMLASVVSAAEPRYNILSLDSGLYKGYMTTSMLQYMEQKGYQIGVRD
jgi:hypothetical protein